MPRIVPGHTGRGLAVAGLLVLGLAGLSACNKPAADGTTAEVASGGGEEDSAVQAFVCEPCVSQGDCGTRWCVQFAADTYCAEDCSQSPCGAGLSCTVLTTESGDSVHACVPPEATCEAAGAEAVDAAEVPDQSVVDVLDAAAEVALADAATAVDPACDYAQPETPGCCKACTSGGNCQANGCFGGWLCSPGCKCVAVLPAACEGTDVATGEDAASGQDGTGTGGLSVAGGELAELSFAVVGDTRPAFIDDTKGYPSAIAKKIWQQVAKTGVPFAVTTGDYIFASGWGTQASPQLDLYLAAASAYSGLRLPALGNHECTGATTSNCGAFGKDGLTTTYIAYLSKMVEPLGLDHPWYAFHVHAPDNTWTAKFVFIAANAWDSEQAVWLDAELAKPTTYTFVVRHEPVAANTAPGVKPSEAILAKYPVTIRLVGHTHTYAHYQGTKELVVGNGGAPLSGASNYGYALAKRRADGAMEFTAYDYSSGLPTSSFAVFPDGSPAP